MHLNHYIVKLENKSLDALRSAILLTIESTYTVLQELDSDITAARLMHEEVSEIGNECYYLLSELSDNLDLMLDDDLYKNNIYSAISCVQECQRFLADFSLNNIRLSKPSHHT